MPYSTWTLWFLAGGLVTVGLGVLLAPTSRGEWVGGAQDVEEEWRDNAGRMGIAAGASGQVS